MLATCRGPPFPLPPLPASSSSPGAPPRCPALSLAGSEPSPAADGRKPTNGLPPREGRRCERGVSSGVMSPARRALPRIVRRRRSPARRARWHSRRRQCGEREGCPAVAPRARPTGCAHPAARPEPGAGLLFPLLQRMGRCGAGARGET